MRKERNEAPAQVNPRVILADWPQKEYSAMLVRALQSHGKSLLAAVPADHAKWCDDFSKADKLQFYVMLVSALARFESGFNTNEKYVEDFEDVNGNSVVSRGLLQISIESANGYGAGIKNVAELHDPEINLRTGVLILNKWIPRDGVVQGGSSGAWRGAARYWSPFRKVDRIAAIQAKVRAACK